MICQISHIIWDTTMYLNICMYLKFVTLLIAYMLTETIIILKEINQNAIRFVKLTISSSCLKSCKLSSSHQC